MNKPTLFPSIHGVKIGLGIEYSDPWTEKEVSDIMYHLAGEDSDSRDLLFESCTNEEADLIMNPGLDMVHEAVTAVYSRLGKTAKALARVFDRYLGEGLSVEGEPYIGPNRKNALFAYKTVTLRVSDGQTVSILFHSPDDDPRKFAPDETLIAYRWMLNKKDITATVAPTRGVEVTLQIMARRMAQLLEANSAKFVEQNEAREALANELIEAEAKREELRGKIAENIGKEATTNEKIAAEDRKASKLLEQLAELRGRNDNLKAIAAEQEAQVIAEAEAEALANQQAQDEADNGSNASPNESGFSFQINKNNAKAILKTLLEEYGKLRKSWLKRRTSNQYIKNPNWSLAIDNTVLKHNLDYKGGNDVDFVLGNSFIPVIAMGGPKSENYAELISKSFYKHLSIQQPGIYFEDDQQHIDTAPLSFDLPAGNENNDTSPDSPSSEQGFATHNFTDRRTQVAAALAEELEAAGFTPASFPIDNPDFVLAENSPVAFEQTLTGNGFVLLDSVLEDGTMNIELSYTEQRQSGDNSPVGSIRQDIKAKVPFGILESKFDDVVSQIEAFFMQFRTPLDDIELPAMGEKLNQEGINQHDVVEIAKAIRKDIKSILPEGFKPSFISVKTSSYSGGASINVSIKKVAEGFKVMETEKAYSREMLALIKVITAVGDAYRYDNSDSMTDYSDTNFFYFVGVASELKSLEQDRTEEEIIENANAMNADQVKSLSDEEFSKIDLLMEDLNWHSERVAFQAKKYLDENDVKAAEEVVKRHQEEGSLKEENYEKRSELSKKIRDAKAALEKDANQEPESMSEAEAIGQELQALLQENDSSIVDQELDVLADKAEQANAMEELDGLLNQVADHLTDLLSKESEGV